MNEKKPLPQPETFFDGEIQVFSGPLLSPDDPSLEPRVRRGRPADRDPGSAEDAEPTSNPDDDNR